VTFSDLDFDPLTAELKPLGAAVPPDRVYSGSPQASGLPIHVDQAVSTGIWEVTPGEFLSIKDGVTEVMYFIAGAGTIEHHTGETTVIAPGAVLIVHSGWSGTWRVTETARKIYVGYTNPTIN
jgi:uncharacterized cupin superfamily protein